MNRSEVITKTAEATSLEPELIEKVASAFFGIISDALVDGEAVNVRRFGKFEPRLRRAMTKPNPKTGQPMEVPERLSAVFLPSEILKNRLNGEVTED